MMESMHRLFFCGLNIDTMKLFSHKPLAHPVNKFNNLCIHTDRHIWTLRGLFFISPYVFTLGS
jgi:hypothetical protein